MKRPRIILLLVLAAGAALLGAGTFGYLMFADDPWTVTSKWYEGNPRMYVQPHIRTYQLPMPLPPAGSVPREDARPPIPTTQQAIALAAPPSTAESVARGEVYYKYYCVFCHGADGRGDGPVGESYLPRPADLTSAKIRAYSDGQLFRASLTGPGHEPVLEYTVLPEHRWAVVHYVRSAFAHRAAK